MVQHRASLTTADWQQVIHHLSMITIQWRWMTPNPHFKGMRLWVYQKRYKRHLVATDIWVNVLCYRQWHRSIFTIIYLRQRRRYMILPVFVCLFVCLWARLRKSRKSNEGWHCRWPWVTSHRHVTYYKQFHSLYEVRYNGQTSYVMWAIISVLSYSTGRTVIWCRARPASDS